MAPGIGTHALALLYIPPLVEAEGALRSDPGNPARRAEVVMGVQRVDREQYVGISFRLRSRICRRSGDRTRAHVHKLPLIRGSAAELAYSIVSAPRGAVLDELAQMAGRHGSIEIASKTTKQQVEPDP